MHVKSNIKSGLPGLADSHSAERRAEAPRLVARRIVNDNVDRGEQITVHENVDIDPVREVAASASVTEFGEIAVTSPVMRRPFLYDMTPLPENKNRPPPESRLRKGCRLCSRNCFGRGCNSPASLEGTAHSSSARY